MKKSVGDIEFEMPVGQPMEMINGCLDLAV